MGLMPPEIIARALRTKSDLATVLTVTPAAWFLEGSLDIIDWSGPSPVAIMAGVGALGLKNTIELAWMGLRYLSVPGPRRRPLRRRHKRPPDRKPP